MTTTDPTSSAEEGSGPRWARPTFVSYDPATHSTQTLASPPFSFTEFGGLAPYKGKIYG